MKTSAINDDLCVQLSILMSILIFCYGVALGNSSTFIFLISLRLISLPFVLYVRSDALCDLHYCSGV